MTLCTFELHVTGSPQPYLIDSSLAGEAARHNWRYDPRLKCARATVRRGCPRVMLHKYLLLLSGI